VGASQFIIVNRLEVFRKSFSYFGGCNYTGTIYAKMNSVRIMFPNRGYVPPKFGGLSFQIIFYALIPVKSIGLNCNFNKLPVMRKLTVIILVLAFLVSPIKVTLFPNVIN
jgi:Na+-transporting NADH:ubiquinone oxidoreductase subunit NqrB